MQAVGQNSGPRPERFVGPVGILFASLRIGSLGGCQPRISLPLTKNGCYCFGLRSNHCVFRLDLADVSFSVHLGSSTRATIFFGTTSLSYWSCERSFLHPLTHPPPPPI